MIKHSCVASARFRAHGLQADVHGWAPERSSAAEHALPAGAVTVDLTLRAATPTLCKYSVGKDLPFDQMTPFDTAAPSSPPRTIVRGLDADPGSSQ